MPYDHDLEKRIDRVVQTWDGMKKKKMFGGICYLLNGNMCFGIYRDYLILRVGVEKAASLLKLDTVKPFDITGRPMKGWVMFGRAGSRAEQDLLEGLELGRTFAASLPKK